MLLQLTAGIEKRSRTCNRQRLRWCGRR